MKVPNPGIAARNIMMLLFFGGVAILLNSPASAGEIALNGLALGSGFVSIPVPSWQEQKFETTIHQEYDFSCGSAALATLLRYSYNIPADEPEVFKGMFEGGDQEHIRREGFSLLDMKKFLAAHHLPSGGFRAPLWKLAGVGIPGIVLINENGYRHFVVLRGIQDGRVLLADPSVGMRSTSVADFEKEWSGIFFAILVDSAVAVKSYNRSQDWRIVPSAPIGIARYAIDNLALQQQATIHDAFHF